jgi:hypothetical protein
MSLIRASDPFIAFLDQYRKGSKLTREQALDQILDRFKYLEDMLGSAKPQENAPECKRRLTYDGKTYCVQTSRKGLNRLKEIPTPDVCHICIEERWHIPKETRSEKPEQPSATDLKVRAERAQEMMSDLKKRGSSRIDMGNSADAGEPNWHEGYR